ncbi:MAG: 5-deoxy-glucuronate isomerase [Bryobacteraceae bacterium]|nr:5-deoxy-glucuronate isomerase [Bryobacteraceae bacterium]MDW8378594.1 5-deoxy-glucuronate isomerase [Bryobacterales bacterium]
MNLLIKSPGAQPGVYPLVQRGKQLKYLSFQVIELGQGLQVHSFETGPEEVALNFYTGPVRVEVDGWQAEIPPRASIREPHPMVYVPAGVQVKLQALNGSARITVGGAEGKPGGAPVLVGGDAIVARSVGKDHFRRTVFTHIADNVPAAHLICGETLNTPGCWSSCPPHKHDVFNAPHEVPMEEIYYFQVEPNQGFGFIRVYTQPDDPNPFDLAYAVEHGDTVLIPRGYHPVVACPGYSLSYTWILAGEGRTYGAWAEDPRHSWIKN